MVPYGTEMAVAQQPVGLFPIFFQFLTSCGMDLQDLSKTEFWKFDPGSSFLLGGSQMLNNASRHHSPPTGECLKASFAPNWGMPQGIIRPLLGNASRHHSPLTGECLKASFVLNGLTSVWVAVRCRGSSCTCCHNKCCHNKCCRNKCCRNKCCRNKCCHNKCCRNKCCRNKCCRNKCCRNKCCLTG